jgi:hypothetical protein
MSIIKKRLKSIEMETDFKFTEEYIQKKLDGFFAESTKKYVLENLYVFNWESDKLIETRSGLIYEFEIKISRSDFKNDFKKKNKHVILEGKETHIPTFDKIESIYKERYEKNYLVSHFKKPNYFYYAVPDGLITVDEVPDYAGLIYVIPEDGEFKFNYLKLVKMAPKLHETKYSDNDLNLGEKFYYNMLSLKDKFRYLREKQLLAESDGQKMTYAELLDKYNKAKKEIKGLGALANQLDEQKRISFENELNYREIIRAYRSKVNDFDKDFNCFEFENKILENINKNGY